jgi:energy-coupling factor transporter ATP-binding protein EcfA2
MSLNFDDRGNILARIEGGKYKKKIVYVEPEPHLKIIKNIDAGNDGILQQVPNYKTERQILYVTGASGSGKTTYICKYAKIYKKVYPKNPIYIFSALKEDTSLDEIEPKRIKISKETLIDDKILIEDLKNSFVIFDDIDCIKEKDLKIEVYNILNECLEVGRHWNISAAISNHLPSNGSYTRRILNEAHSITYFPNSGSIGKIKRFLEEYVGVDKDEFKRIKKSKSRWCTIFKNYPMVIMTQHNIRLMDDEDTDSEQEKNVKNKVKTKVKNKEKKLKKNLKDSSSDSDNLSL